MPQPRYELQAMLTLIPRARTERAYAFHIISLQIHRLSPLLNEKAQGKRDAASQTHLVSQVEGFDLQTTMFQCTANGEDQLLLPERPK